MKVWRKLLPMVLAFVLIGGFWTVYTIYFVQRDALVVYCSHDATYSDAVLKRFTEKTGIKVRVKGDSEATKSLGLVELLLAEKDSPRCDVFWNNELLGMLALQNAGVLQPWKGVGHARIPEKYKDPEGAWTGFGARARVYILNSDEIDEQAVATILTGSDLSRTSIAKPLFGTTLTHYAALWQQLGSAGMQEWHNEVRRKGMLEVNGNAMTKNLVVNGTCDLGYTDTDDFFSAMDAGAAVAMLPARLPDGTTICIPNTVAIIRGSQRSDAAQQLVDFLLSEENEVALANSASRQIPLGPVDLDSVPVEVRAMLPWLEQGTRLTELVAARQACLTWLKGLDD
ncbi:MAG: iron(III) transport system substrate-binding protein [Verrucomicrobiales bacterium]|jgi:iron(III) transport system substrate-binding protein